MTLGLGLIGFLVVVLMAAHRQAAARMLVVDPEAQERGILFIAESARPALVVTEIAAIALVVALASHVAGIDAILTTVLVATVLVAGLLIPVPASGGKAGPTPVAVRFLGALARSDGSPVAAPVSHRVGDPLDERVLAGRMLRFQEQEIDEIMVPRRDVVAIERGEALRVVLDLVEEHRHSRYPLFDGDIDHVVGYLHVFDLRTLPPGSSRFDGVLRNVLTVPEGKRCTDLLEEMLREGHEFCLVVDEFGGTAGIVTTEDLVEELVGEILDEHEKASVMLRRVGRNVYVSQATISLAELAAQLHLEVPDGDYETLSGFLLESFGRIPVRGETVSWRHATFEVLRADKRRIESVQITLDGGGGRA